MLSENEAYEPYMVDHYVVDPDDVIHPRELKHTKVLYFTSDEGDEADLLVSAGVWMLNNTHATVIGLDLSYHDDGNASLTLTVDGV